MAALMLLTGSGLVLGSLVLLGWFVYVRYLSGLHVKAGAIPGPRFYLPVLGNLLDLSGGFDHILNTLYVKWPQTYGEIYRIFVGPECYVCLSSPELMEPILNSSKIIDKGFDYNFLVPWLGYGLLISTGAKWRSRRKLLTPAFHYQILDSFLATFNEHSRILSNILMDKCNDDGHQKVSSIIDLHPLITRCSLDIICEAAMGTRIGAQLGDSDYVEAVYRYGTIYMERVQKPWLTNDTLYSMSPLGREQRQVLQVLHGFTDDVINKRRELTVNQSRNKKEMRDEENYGGLKNRLALLDLLLEASEDGKVLSQLDIREEIDTFMFEGHDTTTSGICWFLYNMAANPDCQERIVEELRDVFGDDPDRDCTQQDLSDMKYLECCIKESLRLHPSVPAIERIIQEDMTIGGYLVPKSSTLLLSIYAMHRNPRIYPDPLVFNPDRFLPDQTVGRHPYAFIPFSAGPRNCIGQRFAMMEIKVVLSTLLRRFKFALSPLSKLPVESTQLILKSTTGINLLVSARHHQ